MRPLTSDDTTARYEFQHEGISSGNLNCEHGFFAITALIKKCMT